ncbi:MAG: MFS transporter [Alteromonadaceae bacterium]|uniref:MFS transporter n=1 Tax=Paraglaciecola chathamensis TaxID=368405 RepID=UPI000C3BD59A|nr:MFS transporter [Paraglaciecola agarilytica]MBN25806.1 MFS transporter [Alteromonadaceae bacterium]|tara:strand:+ start:70995 stop:72293 length:1299 start_codon:yes stop_codon:yes gene_type:complete
MVREGKMTSVMGHMLIIILAGELIFALPFHLARFFRPTFLQAFGLTNTQLGDIFAVYGVVAMLSYFPGGIIADKYPPNRLMSFSLLATALGGLYLLSGPSHFGLTLLFAYWGATTVLVFWAAMIKATRLSAPSHRQGFAFGLLDGGRGLAASLFASVGILLLSFGTFNPQGDFSDAGEAFDAMRLLIIYYTVLTALAAGLTWFFVSVQTESGAKDDFQPQGQHSSASSLGSTLINPLVWLQGGIVICAYCGYKALDNYSLFVVQHYGWSQVEGAQFITFSSYMRPVAALVAGILADRLRTSKMTYFLFAALGLAFAGIAWMTHFDAAITLVLAMLLFTFFAVFALRGIYFALVDESQIRMGATGTAVGIISVLGFTPDIFFASISGRMLDAGQDGFGYYFLFVAGIMFVGCLCALVLALKVNKMRKFQAVSA